MISEKAIKLARLLAEKAKLEATFVPVNIYDLPDVLEEKFDIVFTSYGVLCWLKEIDRWAEVIAHFLKPGGIFYIVEFHRFMWVFDWDAKDGFMVKHSYFHNPSPLSYTTQGSYAETDKKTEELRGHEWAHPMGEVITALIKAGLHIEFLHEFAKSPFKNYDFLSQSDDGYWRYDHPTIQLPLVFSLMAKKE